MAFSLEVSQQAILDQVKSTMPPGFKMFEIAAPEPETLERNGKGEVEPYMAYQFVAPSDAGSRTFGGVRTASFWLGINFQVVSSDAALGRKLNNRLFNSVLGFEVPYGGQVETRFSGPMLPIGNMDGTLAAYIFPSSFGAQVQLFNDV